MLDLKRREFITLVGGGGLLLAAKVRHARGQQQGKTYRVGWLQPGPILDPWVKGFRQGLQDFKYVEGKNLIVEYRWGDGNFDRLPAIAAELVRLNPDVIISVNTAAVLALQKATTTIPIVMLGTADPVASGLVRGLARPGGNITGMSVMAPELSRKRLELLKEAVPNLDRVTVLSNSGYAAGPRRRGDRMKRREFITLLGGAATLPLAARRTSRPPLALNTCHAPLAQWAGAASVTLPMGSSARPVTSPPTLNWHEMHSLARKFPRYATFADQNVTTAQLESERFRSAPRTCRLPCGRLTARI